MRFDIRRDNALIAAGSHFWCGGRLCAVPIGERSTRNPDYCHACLAVIEKEKRGGGAVGHWQGDKFIIGGKEFSVEAAPAAAAAGGTGGADTVGKEASMCARGGGKPGVVSNDVPRIMSTLAGKKIEVDIIHPPVVTERPRRGPRAKALPVELVVQWAAEGIGSKAIATRLKVERGLTVSYKTIQRVLSGQRKQLALPISET